MRRLYWGVRNSLRKNTEKDKRLTLAIKLIVGSKPFNLHLYRLAMQHSSVAKTGEAGFKESNERLEYLGDAILGAVVADYLFKKYPFKNEGFLTEIRSRMVNRESLNQLGRNLGLDKLVEFDKSLRKESYRTIYGNALEALIGAVYLDKGFDFCKKFIEKRLLSPYFHLDTLIHKVHNHKSLLIEWAQKENRVLNFVILDTEEQQNNKEFTAAVTLEGDILSTGKGSSKKKAEKDAARKACIKLRLEEEQEHQ
ncbi:ribonuclease III [Nafulsella turpanensis]|uniref:ribonuclease III n=1 Tax=Nafulsella turpanensis TaxID=1265690 RepID=UPI00034A70AD|nr:ribonuclease III [Nafulsella turpanensis]